MSRAVVTNDSRPVNAENHRQILQRDFLKNLVKTSLQKSRINTHNRPQPLLGKAGRNIHRCTFCNSHIIIPVGEMLAKF